ncbi:MAG: PDZ domain-containing protein [Acidobacteria bacterium]|nr:PDZ domain-containing protein [Acidobacteriota bacterium]
MKRFHECVERPLLLLSLLLLAVGAVMAAPEARLLRFPHIQGDKVVFVYGGDLWTVSARGGEARRLTSFGEGFEVLPKISPDGRWVAFSGEYAGNRQIYVIPYEGGIPKQVTFYPDVGNMPPRGGYDHLVYDWTPDGKKILIKSNRTPYGERIGKYFLVDPTGNGVEEPLQIPEGGPATLSPDGTKLAYSIISREFRTWKRYRAGRAQDLWIYDLKNNQIEQLTEFEGTDNFPMWVGDRIYFTSDRDRLLNLHCFDLNTRQIRHVTDFTDYDCLFPARGGDQIIFQKGGYLWVLDTQTDEAHRLDITLADDRPATRPVFKNVTRNIEDYTISPSGARAVFSARGDLFTVPAEHGPVRNITLSEGYREMGAQWSSDGKSVSYLAETDGYYEIFIRSQDGSGDPVQLTSGNTSWILGHAWSPDSKKIAFVNMQNELLLLDVQSREVTKIDSSSKNRIQDGQWSADSSWIVYSKMADNNIMRIWGYSLADDKTVPLTSAVFSCYSPSLDPEGKYLYFISARDFNLRERDFSATIYAATLRSDVESPLAPQSDEEKPAAEKKAAGKAAPDESAAKVEKNTADEGAPEKKEAAAEKTLVIEAEGMPDRVVALLTETGRYRQLQAVKGGVVFLKGGDLQQFSLEKRKAVTITKGVQSYSLTTDGKKALIHRGQDYFIIPMKPGVDPNEGKLNLGGMEMRITPLVEWRQIYSDAWRIMRDWFYDPNLHGVDWPDIHDKYEVMLPYLAHRADLDFLIGEMISELNAGHTYVFPGDAPAVERVDVGLLGCEFSADGEYYRIARIYHGENWDTRARSPLNAPGLNVTEGTYLLAVDGQPLTTAVSPYSLLQNKAGRQVRLTIHDKPARDGARDITVIPIQSELRLRYLDWVENNRAIVDKLSGGRIGYVHVPNTAFEGFEQMYKWFTPLTDKEALIVDDRYNGGGYSPLDMAELLAREPIAYWSRRHLDLVSQPFILNDGPKVMLINGYSSSGGDAFPFYFRELKLGSLMGKKTWGGLIGYGYSPRFVDGGGMAVPSSAFVNKQGEWDVEAVGVDPDIEVFDDPTLIVQGREPMLEAAVEHLLKELEKNPRRKVDTPPHPIRK